MAKEYNINDSTIHRTVLRSLVSYGYGQIRKIYYASNINSNISNEQKANNIKNINDMIGGCFLSSSSLNVAKTCANIKGWQDYLSSSDLFHLFTFQSSIIKNISNIDKPLEVKDFENVFSLKQVYKWIPNNISLEKEKVYLPAKDSPKRDFIDRFDVRERVLTEETLRNLKEKNFTEEDALQTKNFIERSGCFDKYSGLVAKSFFNAAKEQIKIESMQDEKNPCIVNGYDVSKIVGKTLDGETLYESLDGKSVGTLSNGNYNGIVCKEIENEERNDIFFVPVCTTDEYLEKNSTIIQDEGNEQQ